MVVTITRWQTGWSDQSSHRCLKHHLRESLEAHLSIVVAAMAVSHYIEHQTGWSIKKFVRATRR
jgi:hypothetical protein